MHRDEAACKLVREIRALYGGQMSYKNREHNALSKRLRATLSQYGIDTHCFPACDTSHRILKREADCKRLFDIGKARGET